MDLVLIIDGLDECDNRRPMIQLIFSLVQIGVKVLVTSRTLPDLVDAFSSSSSLEVSASANDLRTFITYKLGEIEEDLGERFPPVLRTEISSTILNYSKGL